MSGRYAWVILLRVAQKEFRHITRDWQTLGILLGLPVFMMFLFGYALNSEVQDAPVAVVDGSRSPQSRALTEAMERSSLLRVAGVWPAGTDARMLFRVHRVRAVVVLPVAFATDLVNRQAQVQILIDGSDPSTGTIVRNAVPGLFQTRILKIAGVEAPSLLEPRVRLLYNPEERSALFFVPGLMATILIIICALMTCITITREKETGTLDNLLVSPASPLLVLLGKMLPFFLIAAVDGVLIMGVGYWAFGVVVQGSLLLLTGATMLYLLVSLSIGLLVSTVAREQQHAMMMVLGITMMPTMLLSGFVFPVDSMPVYLQAVAHVVPATWYLRVVRGIVLKGLGLSGLWLPLSVLAVQFILLIVAAVRKFELQR